MNEQPLFRAEATAAIENSVSTALLDRRIKKGSGLLPLLILIAVLCAGAMFIQVSLGVSAKGVVRAKDGAVPILAEQGGVLTKIISERELVDVQAGAKIATIRNLDLVALRRGPKIEFSKVELAQRRQRLEVRLSDLSIDHAARTTQIEKMDGSLTQLSEKVAALLPVYRNEVGRYERQLVEREGLLSSGILRKEEVEVTRDRLVERKLQLNEAEIRIVDYDRQRRELALQRTQLDGEYNKTLLDVRNSLADVDVTLQAETDLETNELTMPQNGTLIPRGFSVGQVVQTGDVLFDVAAPGSDIYLFEADLPASRIGGLKEGLSTRISVEAYPFFEYGFIDGRVKLLSEVPNQSIEFSKNLPTDPLFRIVIEPTPSSINSFKIRKNLVPGMPVEIHIRKESIAFWKMLFAPLYKLSARMEI